MNVASSSHIQENSNILSLFANDSAETRIESKLIDPFEELAEKFENKAPFFIEEEVVKEQKAKIVVRDDQTPEYSLYVLDEQLKILKNSLGRLKFYLSEIDDLVTR